MSDNAREFRAIDYGIEPGKSVGKQLKSFFDMLALESGQKIAYFEGGTYYIDSEDIKKARVDVTNTIGIKEWRKGEDVREQRIAIDISGVDDLTIDWTGVTFVLRGVMTNMRIANSNRLCIKGGEIDTEKPNLHLMKIDKINAFSYDFSIDKESDYIKENGKYYFVGKDYKFAFNDSMRRAWWIGYVSPKTPNTIRRHFHPLIFAYKVKEIGDHKFRAYTFIRAKLEEGADYYLYDVRRKNVGIFIDSSNDITIKDTIQTFNYALGVVGQNSSNIHIDGMKMQPKDDSMKMCSIADFMHFAMCSGNILVENCHFDGAGDDCINVHGIHFQVVAVNDKGIVVKFMHPQTYGFNPLEVGDEIRYIDRKTMLPVGKTAIIKESKLINEYEIQLVLDSTESADTSYNIEDITKRADFTFRNNYMTRIITRGILSTTYKTTIDNNVFDSTSMHSILFSDDANNWYESGIVESATITNNTFENLPTKMNNIDILPENAVHSASVHGDFVIRNNVFNNERPSIRVKSTRSVLLEGNNVKLDANTKNVESYIEK